MASNRPGKKAIKERAATPFNRELVNGAPWLGAQGPEGSKFVGWVLVQVWEPRGGRTAATVNWSGNEAELFSTAVTELQGLVP